MAFIGLFFKKTITADQCVAKLQEHQTKLKAQVAILDTEIDALEREIDLKAHELHIKVNYSNDPEMKIKGAKRFALSEAISKASLFETSYGTAAHKTTYNDLKTFLEEALASENVIAGTPLNRTQNLLRPLLADVLKMEVPVVDSPSASTPKGATAAGTGEIGSHDAALDIGS